jgi:hypothetical protein
LDKKSYRDELAPFEIEEDFSTSSLQKDLGDKLTTEKLAKCTV